MVVNISYVEEAGSMSGLLIVEDPTNPNSKQEFRLPKFMLDLVKAGIQDGTLNLSTLWSRVINLQKALP